MSSVLELKSLDSGVDLWAGEFGNDYLRRNQVEWRDRIPFWSNIMRTTGARSVFEMGANAGWNLSAIRRVFPDVMAIGNDINTEACKQAWSAGLNVVNKLDFTHEILGRYELVFTAGVLIHIEPEHLREVMQALIDKSYRWVLAVEYAADSEEQVQYRGHKDKCWRRPYGEIYQDMGLLCREVGNAGAGFDRCTYWLMEKV